MTIKKISGGVLLYLYVEVRKHPQNMMFKGVTFYGGTDAGHRRDEFELNLLTAASGSENDLYNSIQYLSSAGLIQFKRDATLGSETFRDFKITAYGYDLIEGVERDENDTRKKFSVTFNFNLDSIMSIKPTLKAQFGLVNI